MTRYISSLTISCLLLCCVAIADAQVIAGFENLGLRPGQYINNAAPEDGFQSGSLELPNFFDTEFQSWFGWAVSADTNTTTPGFLNQYSSIVGKGALGTSAYAIAYIYDPALIRLRYNAVGKPMIGMYVTNSTYAYLSMRDGDAFAKKFGGESGNDPDFFLMTIKKYAGGVLADDSINVYLADYRSPDPSKDYILNEWRYVNLTTLGEVDSLSITLSSSDVGIFGMNTPAYVCIDQVSTDNLLSASFLSAGEVQLSIHPNPAHETLYLNLARRGEVAISNIQGIVTWSDQLEAGDHQVQVVSWPKGLYFISFDGFPAARISID